MADTPHRRQGHLQGLGVLGEAPAPTCDFPVHVQMAPGLPLVRTLGARHAAGAGSTALLDLLLAGEVEEGHATRF